MVLERAEEVGKGRKSELELERRQAQVGGQKLEPVLEFQ